MEPRPETTGLVQLTNRGPAPAPDVSRHRTSRRCPACHRGTGHSFHEVPDVPVHSCVLLESETAALDFPRGSLDIRLCDGCGFIWNAAFAEASMGYAADYEETQGFSPTFRRYATALAQDWVRRFRLSRGRVLEIGCGKGEFLELMVNAGAASGRGIDPAYAPGRLGLGLDDRLEFLADAFRPEHITDDVVAVVCRHTLEHIPDALDFLERLRAALAGRPDVVVLFEVPDTGRILDEGAFWDLYHEHCSYFTAASLEDTFRRAEFDVTSVDAVYGSQYLLLEARPRRDPVHPPAPPRDLAGRVRDFQRSRDRALDRWRHDLATVSSGGGRCVLWGASSKAVGFLVALDPARQLVSAAIDVNPFKHGRYLAGTGHEIIAPERIRDVSPDLVVVMNPVYIDEITATIETMGIHPEVVAL